ncbi:MAG TPA: M50 family metallopeptidase [Candidatus Dormibacteraeota bacterium]|nr:M50 family metallopeptidase [Candidatus Dormibacteraeota bacterium]
MNELLAVVGVAAMFLILIAPHEAGHFALAKLFKVRVIEFSIGAGTRIWSTTRGGTLYAMRAFPILGYVRMGGMEAGDFEDPNGFHRKKAWQRILILAAGPAANFLVAILLITGYNLTQLNNDPGKVAEVLPNSPAAAAGFQAGDRLRAVEGKPITAPDQLKKAEDVAPNASIVVTGVHADGRPFTYVVTPKCGDAPNSCQVGLRVHAVITLKGALLNGVTFPVAAVVNIVQGLSSLVTGQVPGGLLGPNGFTGPIGISVVAAESASLGIDTYIFFAAVLSVALGFTNLLPLLALDGGRVVVVVIEAVRRRPFDRAAELNFQRFGLVALLGLAVVISFLDVQRIATGQFPGLR